MSGEKPTLDAHVLRRLGETADGSRDEDLVLVLRQKDEARSLEIISVKETNSDGALDEVLAHVRTRSVIPDRIRVERVEVTTSKATFDVCQDFDAIFWTESSVEKFVFPYYEHMRTFDESYLEGLKRDFRDPTLGRLIVAIGHRNPSRSVVIEGGCPPAERSESGGTMMYLIPERASLNLGDPWFTPEKFRALPR